MTLPFIPKEYKLAFLDYYADDTGDVWRADGLGEARRPPRDFIDSDGYRMLRDGQALGPRVHRLVCEAVHGPAPSGCGMVRHLDGVKSNNAPSNLSWGNIYDNLRDYMRQHPERFVWSPESVSEARELARGGYYGSLAVLVSEVGSNLRALRALLSGHTWSGVVDEPALELEQVSEVMSEVRHQLAMLEVR